MPDCSANHLSLPPLLAGFCATSDTTWMKQELCLKQTRQIHRRLNQLLHALTPKQYSSSGSGKARAELRTEEEAGVKAAGIAHVCSLDVRFCKWK